VITSDVSFRLAPRLNAAGRLGDAQVALDLCCWRPTRLKLLV